MQRRGRERRSLQRVVEGCSETGKGTSRAVTRVRGMAGQPLRLLISLAIGVSAAIAAMSMLGGVGGAWNAAVAMDLRWLALGLAFETAAYGLLALHVRWVVRDAAQPKLAAPFRTALVLFGLGSVLPAAP